MKHAKMLKTFWTISIIGIGILLTILAFSKDLSIAADYSGSAMLFTGIVILAFFAEYVDSSLGMGYGTTLTPLLLILGYSPLQIVPAVLLSEFVSGITSGTLHHKLGNVDLGRKTAGRKIMLVLALCSLVGTVLAVFLAISLPKTYVKAYIGIMILSIGLFIFFGRRLLGGFSWSKIAGVGTIAAFNKGISGGGYGPVVTGGQIVAGVPEKHAVGITSFAEGLVCAVGLVLYILLGQGITWSLCIPLVLGALLSVPAAVWTVKVLPESVMRRSIGYATLFLGTLTLIRVIL